ncbi:MAG: lysophospholipid acyltransferase family protein [Opitutales bacterium]
MVMRAYNPYGLARGAVRKWFFIDNRFEVFGEGHIPRQGPFLLASNHASFIDPPVVSAAVPTYRQIYFFARKSLFKGWFGKLIASLHAIPIDRDADSDLAAFRRVFDLLNQGHPLLVFPEGTRSPDGQIGRAEKGVGLIACRAQVPIVPARVFGSYEYWGRQQKLPKLGGQLAVTFGAPFEVSTVDPGKKSSERYAVVAQKTLDTIASLPPPPGWTG